MIVPHTGHRKSVLLAPAGACLVLLLTGCATVLHGTSQQVIITSDPSGAYVSDGTQGCETPCSLVLSKRTVALEVVKAGYEPRVVPVAKGQHRAAYIPGNLFNLTFGLGMIVDARTGGRYDLHNQHITLQATTPRVPAVDF